jgi:heme-degrading monooxygenase HmoA
MIVRMWCGFADRQGADAYRRHLLETVRPKLERIAGFRGLSLLRRDASDEVEYQVLTMWESMHAVRAFAGDHPERAVVEPEAAAVLTRFDTEVRHYDVVAGPTIDSVV